MPRPLRLVVITVGLLLALAAPLGAHSEVFERAPLAGEPIGGTVDQIDISFWTPILSSRIQVTDPNGEPVEVAVTELSGEGRIASTTFPAITEPGRYVVSHGELSFDGDLQEAEWFFVFDPTSDVVFQPLASGGDGGTNWLVIAGVSGVLLVAAGVLWPKKSKAVVTEDSVQDS